ncbi:TnpV protein, partial [Acutalibacter muris]|uniref:TnpV protein n=1 Tax=Acutalibacter muris TaxID=1796620 RepID=UPI00272D8655
GHLTEIEQAANRRLELLMPQLKESMGLTEQMKAIDPMKWVGLMNNAKAKAEETILGELIYS